MNTFSKNLTKISAAFAISFSLMATASNAATVTIDGSDFEVSTVTGSFLDNQALLESQAWFGDIDLAGSFVEAVGLSLTSTEAGFAGRGALFVTARTIVDPSAPPITVIDPDTGEITTSIPTSSTTGVFFNPDIIPTFGSPINPFGTNANLSFTYAVATELPTTPVSAVPLPASALLLLSGFVGLVRLRRTKQT